MKTKLVNIYPSFPITTIMPPVRCATKCVTKSIDEIRRCIIARAIVEEILEDGTTINLDFSNYDQDNNPNISIADVVEKAKETIIETPVEVIVEEEPVIEEVSTVIEDTVVVETEEVPEDEIVVEESVEEEAEAEPVIEEVEDDDQHGF